MSGSTAGIVASGLTKRYGAIPALLDVDLHAQPGRVTALLGRNGAGKSTLLSMLAGLTLGQGDVSFDGVVLADVACPPHLVGFVFDAGGFHPTRPARDHLRMVARALGIPAGRVATCLEAVGLTERAKDAPATFSYGMRQRLALASALLGDPPIIVMDEPLNGLDPPGTVWLREQTRAWADEGRTVLLSSHNLPEVELVADDVHVIDAGRTVTRGGLRTMLSGRGGSRITVSAVAVQPLAQELRARGGEVTNVDSRTLEVAGVTAEEVGTAARDTRSVLLHMAVRTARLEDVVLDLRNVSP